MQNQQKYSQIFQRLEHGKEDIWRQRHPLPPFTFHGVTARVFPLQADIGALDNFCREYLNVVPSHIAHFRPAAPFVYLAVLRYEEMRTQSEPEREVPQEQAKAWVSQYEVVFTVPLERYREEDRELVFKNWAFAGPFIFVSDSISVTLGREMYGWQKLAARIEPDFDDWIVHPRSRSHLLTLSTSDAPLVSILEKKEEHHPLLKIEIEPPPSFSQLRPDRNPFALPLNASQAILDGLGTMVDWFDVFAGLPLWGSGLMPDRRERQNRQAQVRKVAESLKNLGSAWSHLLRDQVLTALFPDFSSYEEIRDALRKNNKQSAQEKQRPSTPFFLDQFTLKQFYNANVSQYACYQALVQSTIEVLQQHNSGVLGDINYFLSDPSGGFRIEICREPLGDKIIKALGLKETKEGDKRVAILKPVYPFWTQADLRYGRGRTLCWRTAEGKEAWHEKDGLSETPDDDSKPPLQHGTDDRENTLQAKKYGPKFPTELPLRYVTIGGTLEPSQSLSPSYKEANVPWNKNKGALSLTIRVYPLKVRESTGNPEESRVRGFVDLFRLDQLFKDLGKRKVTFSPLGKYAYLIILNEADDSSSRETPWEVTFAVPVKWTDGDESALALFSPFVFVEAENAVIVEREVLGQPTVDATLTTTDSWLREDKLEKKSSLTLKTKVIPDLNAGGKVEEKELLRIEQSPPNKYEPNEWKHDDNLEVLAKAQVLALEILTEKRPLRSIMLKWFLDAKNPEEKTCYQAVVTTRRMIQAFSIRPANEDAMITIHKYNHYPIVDRLGLVPLNDPKDNWASFRSVSPFSIEVKMTEEPAMDAYQCLHDGKWEPTPFFEAAIENPEPLLGLGVLKSVHLQEQNFQKAVDEWRSSSDDPRLTSADIQVAMDDVDPLEVIQSIVNGKWLSQEMRDQLGKQNPNNGRDGKDTNVS